MQNIDNLLDLDPILLQDWKVLLLGRWAHGLEQPYPSMAY